MEIDNLTRLIEYACYACEIIREDALRSKQEALTNGISVDDLEITSLDIDVSYYDRIQEAFSSVVRQLMKDQKTSDESQGDCAMIRYFCRDPLSDVRHFSAGIFLVAADEYQKRYDEEHGTLDERKTNVKAFDDLERAKLDGLYDLIDIACDACKYVSDKVSSLIQKKTKEGSTVDGEILELETDRRYYLDFQDIFSSILKQLEEDLTTSKKYRNKCETIESVCHDYLSHVRYFNIDIFLLAADEYKRRYDKERWRLPKRFSKLFRFLKRRLR